MKVIFVRSPYKIFIDEPTQLLTKVNLFIWRGNETEPTVPTKVLQKQITDIVNYTCEFNISPYIKDYIEPIAPTSIEIGGEDFDMWRKVKVVKYYKANVEDTWTELDTETFVAVNGYSDYLGGLNQSITTDLLCLVNSNVKLKRSDNNQYFNVLVDYDNEGGYDLIARYRNLSNTIIEDVTILNGSKDSKVYMLKVPYRTSDSGLSAGSSVQLRLNTSGDVAPQPFIYFVNEDECLYTPVKCSYINKSGGWQFMTFFKARMDNYDTQSKEHNLLPNQSNYNPLRGQKKSFNFEQKQKVKLNSGWVDENYIELFSEMINSETILIDNIPATLTNKSVQKKTILREKMINYEMEFEYAFNLINDVN